ncbi:MAG TPA: M17 family peptidase N-terminal domain-containing protein, partial [Kiritimatiellia bacterium]
MGAALSSKEMTASKSDALVLFTWAGDSPSAAGKSQPTRKLVEMCRAWTKRVSFRAQPGDITHFPTWGGITCPNVIVAGLGGKKDFHIDVLRRAAGAASRRAARLGAQRVGIDLSPLLELRGADLDVLIRALVASLEKALYGTGRKVTFTVHGLPPKHQRRATQSAMAEGHAMAEAVSRVRELANLPGNEAPPEVVAQFARRFARQHGLRCDVWNKARLVREQCRSLLAVAQGSRREPRLIILRYPGRKKKSAPLVLVGKTITFDTGGISI